MCFEDVQFLYVTFRQFYQDCVFDAAIHCTNSLYHDAGLLSNGTGCNLSDAVKQSLNRVANGAVVVLCVSLFRHVLTLCCWILYCSGI